MYVNIKADEGGKRLRYTSTRSKSIFPLILIAVCLAAVSAVAVTGLLTASRTISSSGTVKAINVEVYWDSGLTNVVSEIDWGTIESGGSVTKTIYITNTGNTAMTLNMTYYGWVPAEAGNYITLSWDKEGLTVDPDAVVAAVLTLSVSETISGIESFSFNIVIEGTG